MADHVLTLPLTEEALERLKAAARFTHTDVAVAMHDKPSQALRKGRWKSSMWLAIEAVKKGEADVAVSAGNTGALMVMAKLCLKTCGETRFWIPQALAALRRTVWNPLGNRWCRRRTPSCWHNSRLGKQ